ncbi:16S rRNA (guanine(527)-N(7))-methyltransferase RsmG [Usitatibacter palustris]|uniref:Ribosomal RNA small subunit methyltransferase G n=1 Tax=Usitatibacter palustris TaxID=2732487 RepID=A0A6M4HAY6_9PROT|nr:16S rRNA (guanine(527)-N(7))-methyltransferase RsmG [Usitatibacter palustris]QJR16969.1 Ribosomal RNA small subunit methyltransferase G [Usitatibacter palustris]
MTLEVRIAEGLAAMGLALPEGAPAKLAEYLELLAKWNKVHNLTAVREPEQMVVLHVLDSLSVLPHVAKAHSLLDVGSGGGLPGIPLAIARPDLEVTLLDSSHKKVAFLQQAKSQLKLANVTPVCERVESWKPAKPFDAVVSRAFADLADFVVQAHHLVAPDGEMLAMKGVHPFDEIAKVPATHRVAGVVELSVPSLDAKRHLVLLKAA